MKRCLTALATAMALALPGLTSAQPRRYPLETTDRLRLHNVTAEPATHEGKKGVRLTRSADAARRLEAMSPDQRANALFEELAWIEGLELSRPRRGPGATESFHPVHLPSGLALVPPPQGDAGSL